jgi:hypothetical protein
MTSRIFDALPQAGQTFSRSAHGRMATPSGLWEYAIVIASLIAVLVAAYLCVRFLLHPEEDEREHIKRSILDKEVSEKPGDDS